MFSTNDSRVCGQQEVPNYQETAGVKSSSNSSRFNFKANIKVVIHGKYAGDGILEAWQDTGF